METTVITAGEKAIGEEGNTFTESQETELINLPLGMIKAKFRLVGKEIIQQKRIIKEKAKQAITDLFKQREELDYIEIMSELGLDLKLIVDICEELEKSTSAHKAVAGKLENGLCVINRKFRHIPDK